MTTKQIREKLFTIADTVSKREGVFTARRGFFYTGGKSSEDFRRALTNAIPEARVIDCGEHWAPFKGGASVAKQSHWWVRFTV